MEQKLISFCVPCYNSAKDMRKCLDSLLTQRDFVEIIIIDDGSKDETPQIADEYAANFPQTVRAVHQPNGGHGSGINHALELATGKFFKVVDSDDWVDQEGYALVLDKIREVGDEVDLFVLNYCHYHVDHIAHKISFRNALKANKILEWKDVGILGYSQNFTLHSVMYKTSVLHESNVHLPEHVFYEDNYFVYSSLEYVKKLYYIDHLFYMYFIGREGQSVSKESSKKRFRDHALMAKLVSEYTDVYKYKKTNYKLYRVLIHHLALLVCIGCTYTRLNGTKEGKLAFKKIKTDLKAFNPRLYRQVRYRSIGFWTMNGYLLMRFSFWVTNLFMPFN